ncbi:AGE family epimerase/isomerase [candidate division KSB1 bacterium]|nr:AGE family epimerase/isomerase [candidate division KSB1 bacterium]
MSVEVLKKLKDEITEELITDILPFWMEKTIDKEHGGFIGEMSNDLTIDPDGAKSLVVCSRMLWTYAAAARVLKDEKYLPMAERALDYLMTRFKDSEYDGYFWWLDAKGNPLELDKKVYGQAFTIYALSEHVRATDSQRSLDTAKHLFELIESNAVDKTGLGYYDFCDRDWSVMENFHLGEGEISAAKTYNTHLHILESYTNLLRVWPDEKVASKLKLLIEIHLDKIYNPDNGHMDCFFDKDWNTLSDAVSYGHDVETSWLLFDGAEVLGDETLLKRVRNLAVEMAALNLEQGVDPDGGMFYEENPREVADPNKHWWPQAEAVVGFLNAWQLSGDQKFLNACVNSWKFIQNKIIDHEHGEWFWSVTRDGEVNEDQPKVSPWKGPYHNGRMGFEVIERVAKMLNVEC